MVSAILTPGQRTVAAALRVMSRSDQRDYARYHEVLNRAVWSPRAAARVLLVLLLQHLDAGDGPFVFGIAETQALNSLTAPRHQVMTMLDSDKNRLDTAIGTVSPHSEAPHRVVGTRVERFGQVATSDFAPESSVA